MLIINDLSFSFGPRQVLRKLSLCLPAGEIGTLIGSSGAGKTSLLKILTGTYPSPAQTICIGGYDGTKSKQLIAYMTQDDLLLPWRTVRENLTLIGELGRNKSSGIKFQEMAAYFLNVVGLTGWENAFPDQLSGGMRQRVSLARALMQQRPLLLLDEPFGALDVITREQLYKLLLNIRDYHGTTILMVTHDFRDAVTLSDRIFLLNEGHISQTWTVTSEIRHDPIQTQQLHNEMRLGLGSGMQFAICTSQASPAKHKSQITSQTPIHSNR